MASSGGADPIPTPIPGPDGRTLTALVTRPAARAVDRRCAVIQVHGGAWTIGEPAMLAHGRPSWSATGSRPSPWSTGSRARRHGRPSSTT